MHNILSDHSHGAASLGRRLRELFQETERARSEIEDRWLRDLRQYKGIYDPDVAARFHPKRSRAFLRLTRNKVRTIDARLNDLLFPGNGDKNWAIEPTPRPEADSEFVARAREELRQSLGREPRVDEMDVVIAAQAKGACERMSSEIEDQLVEAGYREAVRDVLHSGNLYGTGVLKGPLVERRASPVWRRHPETGEWRLKEERVMRPFLEFAPVWDVYPDMTARSVSQARFIFQRHVMTGNDLRALARREDFDAAAIESRLSAMPGGDAAAKSHETELSAMNTGETSRSRQSRDRYEVLEFWGYIPARDLAPWDDEYASRIQAAHKEQSGGLPAAEEEAAATVWTLADEVIKAAAMPLPGGRWPYYFYYFDKDETSIFGEGVAGIMRDPQQLFNASVRALLDNAAISAGPQVEVNMDLLPEHEDPTDIHPFRVWLRTGMGADAANPAIRVFSLPSHTQEFMNMAELFGRFADQSTAASLPMPSSGEPAHATMRGLSMLMGAASVALKDQVRHFDDGVTRPFLTAMYHWNMEFNPREDIKGDFQVRARGWTSLVAREIHVDQIDHFAQATANKIDAPFVNRPELLRRMAEARDLGPEVVKTDDQLREEMEMMAGGKQGGN